MTSYDVKKLLDISFGDGVLRNAITSTNTHSGVLL